MIYHSKTKILGFILCVLSGSLVVSATTESNFWSQKMMNFINPVKEIYSIDLNKPNFDEKEKQIISKAIKDLENTTHGLKFSFISFFSKKDPAIEAEFTQFKNSLDMAEKTLPFNPKQSTYYIRSAIGQCAACHSNGGKSTHLFDLFKETKMPAFDKARLALALRDYETSAETSKSIMLDPALQNNYFRMNDVIVSYLNSALLSNYKTDKIIADLLEVTKSSKNKATVSDLNEVINDVKTQKNFNNVSEAINYFQSYSKDLVNFDKSVFTTLKIKNFLHSNLRNVKSLKEKALAYEALGDIYSHFAEISIFMVPESYYELCVKTQPKSEISKKCFDKYQSKVALGYSGSMGISIPQFEKAKIDSLKKLAE